MKLDENWLKDIARQYIEMDGGLLKEEIVQLKEKPLRTEGMDFLLKKKLRKVRTKGYTPWIGGAAACLAALLVSTTIINHTKLGPSVTESILRDYESGAGNSMISLSLNLPDQFRLSSTKQDYGETIYYLEEDGGDDVVLVVKEAADDITGELKNIVIDGNEVQGLSFDDYQILSFKKDNIQYTLTCRYEFQTLVELSKSLF